MQGMTDDCLAVKGAAMEASPGLTMFEAWGREGHGWAARVTPEETPR